MIPRLALLTLVALGLVPSAPLPAQVMSVRSGADSAESSAARDSALLAGSARREQALFEQFRRANVPTQGMSRGGGSCDEQVGRFCYWYDEKEPPAPPEGVRIRDARDRLLVLLDSAARENPGDGWVASQRVRYLDEAGREGHAVAAARACRAERWWCGALLGLALHVAGDYERSDSAFNGALSAMTPQQRCEFTDISLLLDDVLLPRYRATKCGSPERDAFERRAWWLARPVFSTSANDARTEFYSRVTMVKILSGGQTAHDMGFDEDERELLIRYSWPRAWTRSPGGLNGGGGIVGHEPSPSYPYLQNALVFDNPVATDSLKWTTQPGVVHARYAPAYASKFRRLDHQAGLFRRGDSSLVVLAYDVGSDSVLAAADKVAALVLTRGERNDATIVRVPHAASRGVITAMSKWEPLLMSAEVVSLSAQRTARARYAVRPPYGVGARVTISDILLFEPFGTLPTTVEQVLPHAMPSLRIRPQQKLGFYWEAYGTNPNGETMKITLTVAPEYEEPGFWQRRMKALRLMKDTKPVSISVIDVSARGATMTPRAVEVDVSTLKPGKHTVELDIEVDGQYVVHAERVIEVAP